MATTKSRTKKLPRGVKLLPDGRYEIRAYWLDPKTGREKEAIETVACATPEEAAVARVRLRERKLSERVGAATERPRFGAAINAWLDGKTALKPSTRAQYRVSVRAWTGQEPDDENPERAILFGDHWLDMVQPADVIEAMQGWREGGLDPHTINGRLRVLRTFAKETRRLAMVEAVRILEHTVTETEEDADEGRGFSVAELGAWFGALRTIEFQGRGGSEVIWRPLLLLLGWTGLRFGEVAALEWRDLDLDAATVRVRRSVWHGQVGHPKAKASKRLVSIPGEVVDALRALRRGVQVDTSAIHVEGVVFRSVESKHGYVSNTGLRKNMIKVCKAAGVDLGARPALHSLRHSVNNILRQHTSELVRQSMIGHADDSMNETYSKVGLDEKRAAMTALVRVVTGT